MKKLNTFEMQKVNGGKVDGLLPPKTSLPKKQTLPCGMTRWIEYVLSYYTPMGRFGK